MSDLLAYPTLYVGHLLVVDRHPYGLVIEPNVLGRFLASMRKPFTGPSSSRSKDANARLVGISNLSG